VISVSALTPQRGKSGIQAITLNANQQSYSWRLILNEWPRFTTYDQASLIYFAAFGLAWFYFIIYNRRTRKEADSQIGPGREARTAFNRLGRINPLQESEHT
jgi:hypothetical protein